MYRVASFSDWPWDFRTRTSLAWRPLALGAPGPRPPGPPAPRPRRYNEHNVSERNHPRFQRRSPLRLVVHLVAFIPTTALPLYFGQGRTDDVHVQLIHAYRVCAPMCIKTQSQHPPTRRLQLIITLHMRAFTRTQGASSELWKM